MDEYERNLKNQEQDQQRPIAAEKALFHAPADVGQLHRRVRFNRDGIFILGVKNLYLGGFRRQLPACGGTVVPVGLQPLGGNGVKLRGGGEEGEAEPQLLRLCPPVSASSCTVKRRLYSTLKNRIRITTTASSSHIAVVDMILSLQLRR